MKVDGLKDVGPNELPPLVMAAHDVQSLTFPDLIRVFDRAVISEIFNGNRTCRFEGVVTYEDIFHKTYTLKCAGATIEEDSFSNRMYGGSGGTRTR
jgi:hypothetical protein